MGREKTFNNKQREEIYNKYVETKSYRLVSKEFGVSIPFVKRVVDEIESGKLNTSKIDIYVLADPLDPFGFKQADKDEDEENDESNECDQIINIQPIKKGYIDNVVKISIDDEEGIIYRLKRYAELTAQELIGDKDEVNAWYNEIIDMIESGSPVEDIINEISNKKTFRISEVVYYSGNPSPSTTKEDEKAKISKRLDNMKEYIQGNPVDINGDLWFDRDGITRYIEKNMYDMTEYNKGCRIRAYENEDKERFDKLRKQANDVYDLISLNIDKSNNINKLNEIGLELSNWYVDIFNKHCTCKSAITLHKILPENFRVI